MIIPVAVQSCRLIPALLLPPADPAGAKPRRDHRFLDRVSRHVVPKTPGNEDAFKVYDPARVSHIPVSQSVRHPSGVAGSLATPDPRVVGATPLDPGLKSGHPCRGASFTTLHNEWSGSCNAQMRHPCTHPGHLWLIRILMCWDGEDGERGVVDVRDLGEVEGDAVEKGVGVSGSIVDADEALEVLVESLRLSIALPAVEGPQNGGGM